MLMFLIAAVVYALVQIMGAETRARANVWATAALGGALMAFLIVSIAPPVLSAVFGDAISCASTVACGGSGSGCSSGSSCCSGVCLSYSNTCA